MAGLRIGVCLKLLLSLDFSMNIGCNGLCDDVILSEVLSVFTLVCFLYCSVVFFRVVKTPENVKDSRSNFKGTLPRSPEKRFFVTYCIKNTRIFSFTVE